MCGIVGIYDYARASGTVSHELVVRMRDTLRHRGPDGEGAFVSADRRIGLGHRRLSIVDPAHGAQPMHGGDGACLVFNGEIYNYPELRESLCAAGVQFATRCDTEIILRLFERHGPPAVEHLSGMFAFALWDSKEEQLIFARDPIGEKPLYWTDNNGVFVFGSEIKALLEHPAISAEVNEAAIGPYLAHLVSPGPETCFKGIYKLPPGCIGTCDARGVRIHPYVPSVRPRRFTEEGSSAPTRIRELLERSVRARLIGDVAVGVLLSGGFDSTAILALLADRSSELASFTVGFPGHEGHDEREDARWVARHFGTTHHEVVLTEDDALNMLGSLIHHQDEPLADPVCIPLHAVCGLAHNRGVKVVLAGEGADELFWGYEGYRRVLQRWRLYRAMLAMPGPVRRLATSVTSASAAPRRREQLQALADGRPNPVHMPLGLTREQRRHLLLSGSGELGWRPSDNGAEPHLTRLAFDTQEYEFHVRLPELLLMRIDRFSMANGVEARVPFLAPELVDYAYGLPLELKVHHGITKFVLKQALADIVPARVAARAKQGFAAPTSRWFASAHGKLLRHLMTQDALRRYFDVDYLSAMMDRANPGDSDTGQVLWPIVNFGLWHKRWIEGESIDDVLEAAARF